MALISEIIQYILKFAPIWASAFLINKKFGLEDDNILFFISFIILYGLYVLLSKDKYSIITISSWWTIGLIIAIYNFSIPFLVFYIVASIVYIIKVVSGILKPSEKKEGD